MGYNKTPQSFERVKDLLDEMLESEVSITWTFNNPKSTRRVIYEGLNYAIGSKKPELEKYTPLLDKFKLRVIEPHILKAELKTVNKIVPNGRLDTNG